MNGDELMKLVQELWAYFWMMLLAMLGGTANYISRVKRSKIPFSVAELLGEWIISGFAGFMTLHICLEQGFSIHLTAFFTGIAGHMGGRAIFLFENWMTKKVKP